MHTVPEKIGKYQIVAELGRGSMGTVYSAHDPFSNRQVAIKLAHPYFADQSHSGQRFRKLFFNEAHAAGLLHHPNILRVYDAGADGDLCYLAMEYVPGARTLSVGCKPETLLPLRDVVSIVYRVAKALDYAHRQGVVHRDIKPSNILLTEQGDVKVADFSIAMVTRPDSSRTQVQGFLGSPLYMSPEQINEGTITSRTDIFSLGSLTYQLLTGHHPFRADNLNAINHKITHEDPPPLETYRANLPEGLEYVVQRMLQKDPDKRYATTLELASDLAVIFEDLEAVETEVEVQERFHAVRALDFFRDFSDSEIWELLRACTWHTYRAGEAIIREGELDLSFYIVLSGIVGIEKNGRHVDDLQEGDCFGEMGYLARTRRTATVVARTDVSLMKINAATIERAAPGVQLRFLKMFVHTLIARLSQATSALSQQSTQEGSGAG